MTYGMCTICGHAPCTCDNVANSMQVGGEHYRKSELQHWDMIEEHGIGYLEACATKYLCRWKEKGGLQDLLKAGHYTTKLRELARPHRSRWDRAPKPPRRPRGYVPPTVLEQFFKNHAGSMGRHERMAATILLTWGNEVVLAEASAEIEKAIMAAQEEGWTENGPPEKGRKRRPFPAKGQKHPFGYEGEE